MQASPYFGTPAAGHAMKTSAVSLKELDILPVPAKAEVERRERTGSEKRETGKKVISWTRGCRCGDFRRQRRMRKNLLPSSIIWIWRMFTLMSGHARMF